MPNRRKRRCPRGWEDDEFLSGVNVGQQRKHDTKHQSRQLRNSSFKSPTVPNHREKSVGPTQKLPTTNDKCLGDTEKKEMNICTKTNKRQHSNSNYKCFTTHTTSARSHQFISDPSDMDQIPSNMPMSPQPRFDKKHVHKTKINFKKKVYMVNHREEGSSPGGSKSRSVSKPVDGTQMQESLEIPGFYYDKEKKKYFRILPYQNNVNVITKEVLLQKAGEELRQRNLAKLHQDTKQQQRPIKVTANRPRCTYSHNVLDLVYGMRTINRTYSDVHWLCPRFLRHIVSNLKPSGSRKIFQDSNLNQYEKLEHMQKMLPHSDCKYLLCLWSLKGLIVQRMQMLKVNEVRRIDECKSAVLDIEVTGSVVLQSFSKVTHICWAPTSKDEANHSSNILYTTTCFLGNNPSMAVLRRLNPNECSSRTRWTTPNSDCIEFNLGSKATWTCAWNPHNVQISIGSEKCGLLLDVDTRKLWELNTRQGDVLSQTFSHLTGQTLYSGTRHGLVCIHDLRSLSTCYVMCLVHKASVCHLHLQKDDNYLLAGDFSGRICKWDLRKQQVVQEFHGHTNQYHTIPFYVDPSETILYAAGQDCYSRLWDLCSGALLRSLPPPCPAALDNIPSLCLIPSLGHPSAYPGLLLGMQDELHFYSS